MRRLLLVTALALLVAPPGPAHAARATVNFNDSAFSPYSVTISAGDDVFWCPNSSNQLTHDITADDGSFQSQQIPPGSGCTWMTFQHDGRFPYHCTHVQGMTGVINVGTSAPVTITTPPTTRPSSPGTTVKRTTATTTRALAAASVRGTTTTVKEVDAPATTAEPVETTTTAGLVAINDAPRAKGGNRALVALVLVAALAGGAGYVAYRRRQLL